MKSQYLKQKSLPEVPGVYFFLGKHKEVLYVGKATSLKSRVASYFGKDLSETRGPLIVQMVESAESIDYRVTDSVLEAIILEADLIKKFQPRFNTKEKSDKSFNCVVITDEDFPRILVVRQKDIDSSIIPNSEFSIRASYGPFPNGVLLRDALKIIRKIFPYRDSKCSPSQGRPCFNQQIGLCPGVCTGNVGKQEYAKTIRNIMLFFSGKKRQLLANLNKEMRDLARKHEFETAGKIKKTIFALQHIQDVSLIKVEDLSTLNPQLSAPYRIEAYDIAHLSGTNAVGAMVVLENGLPNKSDYRKFKIRGGFGNNDIASLTELIERRLKHIEWQLPSLIVADGGLAQLQAIESVLKKCNFKIPVVAVTKNNRHKPEKIKGNLKIVKNHQKEILLANNEAHRFAVAFHRERRSKIYNS